MLQASANQPGLVDCDLLAVVTARLFELAAPRLTGVPKMQPTAEVIRSTPSEVQHWSKSQRGTEVLFRLAAWPTYGGWYSFPRPTRNTRRC